MGGSTLTSVMSGRGTMSGCERRTEGSQVKATGDLRIGPHNEATNANVLGELG